MASAQQTSSASSDLAQCSEVDGAAPPHAHSRPHPGTCSNSAGGHQRRWFESPNPARDSLHPVRYYRNAIDLISSVKTEKNSIYWTRERPGMACTLVRSGTMVASATNCCCIFSRRLRSAMTCSCVFQCARLRLSGTCGCTAAASMPSGGQSPPEKLSVLL